MTTSLSLHNPSLRLNQTNLYFSNPEVLRKQLEPNLKKSLKELEFRDGDIINVSDVSLPTGSIELRMVFE